MSVSFAITQSVIQRSWMTKRAAGGDDRSILMIEGVCSQHYDLASFLLGLFHLTGLSNGIHQRSSLEFLQVSQGYNDRGEANRLRIPHRMADILSTVRSMIVNEDTVANGKLQKGLDEAWGGGWMMKAQVNTGRY